MEGPAGTRVVEEGGGGQAVAEHEEWGGEEATIAAELGFSELERGFPSRKKGRKGNKLPPDLAKLMGEANLCYADREFSKAVGLLLEVVRCAPNVADPYHTLGLIYEDMGEREKALEFYMIAAHLTPKNPSSWKRLGLMWKEEGKAAQAAYCYSRALRLDPNDLDALWDRSIILGEQNKLKQAIEGFATILQFRPGDADVSKELSRLCYQAGQTERAIDVLSTALKLSLVQREKDDQVEVDANVVNMLAELYMELSNYEKAAALIEQTNALFPSHLDLAVNYGICQLHLGNISLAERHLEKLMEKSVEGYGDLFYDVAETFMGVGETAKAACVYERLLADPTYRHTSLYLKLGLCYRNDNPSAAIRAYETALQLEPESVEASLALSDIYQEMKKPEQALAVVSRWKPARDGSDVRSLEESDKQDMNEEELRMLVKRGELHYLLGQHEDFLRFCLPIVTEASADGRDTMKRRKKAKRRKLYKRGSRAQRQKGKAKELEIHSVVSDNLLLLGEGRKLRKPKEFSEATSQTSDADEHEPTNLSEENPEEGTMRRMLNVFGAELYYSLVHKVCRVLVKDGQHVAAATLVRDSLTSRYTDKHQRDRLQCLYVGACEESSLLLTNQGIALHGGDLEAAYEALRYVCMLKPYASCVWNIFNRTVSRMGRFNSSSNHKFLIRQLLKHPDCVELMLLVAHNCHIAGSFRLAIGEYLRAYRSCPNHPLVSLCIALAYLQQVMNRRQADRHYLACQAMTFLFQYHVHQHQEPGRQQEAAYNVGRALHQLDVLPLAVHYYELALAAPPLVYRDGTVALTYDLRYEAAHNLALIYSASSPHLAQHILWTYCVVE